MTTTKSIEILLLPVFVFVIGITMTTKCNGIVAANESSKFSSNVDTSFAISSSRRNDYDNVSTANNGGGSQSENSSNFTIYVNKSTVASVNIDDDVAFDSDENESKNYTKTARKLRRGKRYLDFVKGTRVSWRTTVKNNILKVNTLWGYGFGFRSNFPFPDKADRLRPFFKRDLLHATVDMLDGHGLDGRACILKSYCMAQIDGQSEIGGGMIFKLLKMLLRTTLFEMYCASATLIDSLKISALILVASLSVIQADGSVPGNHKNLTLKRGKRFLDILPTTRLFYRANCKNNIIKRPIIWANGYGFRANFPIDIEPKARPFKRDTYELMRELMDESGFDGEACLLKAFCTAHIFDEENGSEFGRHGMLFKLLKHIFTLDHQDKRHFPYLHLDNCQQILHSHCPLSFNSISPYTDDV